MPPEHLSRRLKPFFQLALRYLTPSSWRLVPSVLAAFSIFGGLATVLHHDQPLLGLAVWRFLAAGGVMLFFLSACLLSGHAIVRAVLGRTLRLAEQIAIAFAVGIGTFHVGVFLLGLCGVLNLGTAVAWPLLLIAIGLRPAWRVWRRARRLVRVFRGTGPQAPRVPRWALAVGAASLLVLFARCLTTQNAGFDSLWYHLPLAETYAVTGAIRPSPEGWLPAAIPQMASFIYAWALLLAGNGALGLVASALVEYTFVLSAVLGVVPLSRALLPRGKRVPWAFASVAMFPAWSLYGPQLEADCLVAAFAPALALLTLASLRTFDFGTLLLWAIVVASTSLVKYTAVLLWAFPCLAMALRTLWLLARPGSVVPSRAVVLGRAAGAAGVIAALTATFWLKNWVFYGNPVYPEFQHVFGGEPWTRAAEVYKKEVWPLEFWRVPAGAEGNYQLLRTLFTFSFEPHEYPEYNPGRPLFGSLFTLTLPALLVGLPQTRRALGLYGGVLVGIAVWLKLHHQDRYLEALLPWMMSVLVATAVTLLRAGPLARGALVAAALLQLVWTLQIAAAQFPYQHVRDVLAAPSGRRWQELQSSRFAEFRKLDRALPPDAVVLLHDQQTRYGVRRRTVSDEAGFQGRLSYVELQSDARIYEALRDLGVTHVHATKTSRGVDALGSDLAFYSFLNRCGRLKGVPELRRMPKRAPPALADAERLVFIDACGKLPEKPGLYRLRDLKRFGQQKPVAARPVRLLSPDEGESELDALLERAEFLVVGKNCDDRATSEVDEDFVELATRGDVELFMRSRDALGRSD